MKVARYDRVNDKFLGFQIVSQEQWEGRARHKEVCLLELDVVGSSSHDRSTQNLSVAHAAVNVPAHPTSVPDSAVWRTTYSVSDKPLASVKLEWRRRVKVHREFVANAGISWNDGSDDHFVQTDQYSQMVVTGAVLRHDKRGNPSATQSWRMGDNTFAELTKAQLEDMAIAVGDHVDACYARQAVLEAAIEAAPDVATVKAIDVTAGWPSHYTP